jgi:hypothetical protein
MRINVSGKTKEEVWGIIEGLQRLFRYDEISIEAVADKEIYIVVRDGIEVR